MNMRLHVAGKQYCAASTQDMEINGTVTAKCIPCLQDSIWHHNASDTDSKYIKFTNHEITPFNP